MKFFWKTCDIELGRIKSAIENYYEKFIWKLPKATAFQRNY